MTRECIFDTPSHTSQRQKRSEFFGSEIKSLQELIDDQRDNRMNNVTPLVTGKEPASS